MWEESQRNTGITIKSVGAEGVTTEQNFVGEAKGFGRLQGLDWRDVGTATNLRRPDGVGLANAQGLMTTRDGEMVVWKAVGGGKVGGGKPRFAGVVTFATASQKLSWMNGLVVFVEGESTPDFQETKVVGYEWK